MIQPQELRIGNYVEYMGEIKPVLSVDGERNDIEMGLRGTVTLPEYMPNSTQVWTTTGRWCAKVNPIPITTEILVSCGFVLKDSYWTHKDIIYGLVFMGANVEVCFSLHGVITSIPHLPLNELHRLQNIIYSLSGQELTFKTTNNE